MGKVRKVHIMTSLDFKHWLINEIVEPFRPKAKKSNIVINPGTNTATPAMQWRWVTKQGNDVKVQFVAKSNDAYQVIFYVNDTLEEDGKAKRDPEILPGVMHIISDRAEKIGAKELSFRGYVSHGDHKEVKNLSLDRNIPAILFELDKFYQMVSSHTVEMIPPSQRTIDLFAKLNRGVPSPKPSLPKQQLLDWIETVKSNLKQRIENHYQESIIQKALNDLLSMNFDLNYDMSNLITLLKKQILAIKSNTEEGTSITKNRRNSIYRKLLKKYFDPEKWEIKENHEYFYVTSVR